MSSKKQTAVEWLIEKLKKNEDISGESPYINSLIRLTIAMEKEQIIDAYKEGYDEGLQIITRYENVEDYYTSTYGS